MEPLALTRLREQRLVAVIRALDAQAALGAARAVAAGGVRIVEITFTVPGAPQVIAALEDQPGLTVGAGTVLTAAQAREALAAGARFLIAPNLSREVADEAASAGVLFCPGAYTTTEILAARDAGAQVVKVYPVGVVGGPAYIHIIRDPLPDIPLLAAGGTTLENVVPFLEAGCVGVGLGAALADPALAAAGRFDELTRRARAFVERLEAAGLRALGA
jgi:2-dehydro-3-deoxyphosphogluconate aldolase/(4S)-4-hydroxy-2-oxoglutarate aldolase